MDNKNNSFDGFDSVEIVNDAENYSPINEEKPPAKENIEAKGNTQKSSQGIFSGGYGSSENQQTTIPTPDVYYNPKAQKENREKAPRPKKQYGIGTVIAVALICSLIVSLGTQGFSSFAGIVNEKINGTTISKGEENKNGDSKVVKIDGSIEELAQVASEKASASVVGVQTTYAVQSFFSGQSTTSGSGSGVIYKSDGYIITNYHVIADALNSSNSSIQVFLDNNTEKGYEAKVINYNISCDLAVLKIEKTGLNAVELGTSKDLKIGQYCVAIGSPGGLEFIGSTSFGIISGLDRKIATTNGEMTLIQTDAAINPGNSGGALVNAKGELIGISSSKLVDTSYEGMGFAIPVDTVIKVCDDLIKHEGEGEAYTGISISTNYTAQVLEYYGYPVGAVVASVDEGSPAQAAGIQRGDIITKFGDTKITEYNLYETALSNYFPKDKVKVTFYREGRNMTTTITIGATN